MSPPEATPFESFRCKTDQAEKLYNSQPRPLSLEHKLLPLSNSSSPAPSTVRVLPSPPVSPWPEKRYRRESLDEGPEGTDGGNTIDPVLYPVDSDRTEIPADQPLFGSGPEPAIHIAEEIVAKHMEAKHMTMHMAEFKTNKKVNQPTREEYLLALSCIPNLGRIYNRNPGAYMKRTREETEQQYWQTKRICANPGTKAKHFMKPLINIAPATPVRQPKRAINAVSSPTPVSRAKRTPKASPKIKLLADTADGRQATPEVRAPGTKRPEDTDYGSLPDYSPPLSTLPKNNPKSLKADWPSSNLLNLSNDPDSHRLHEAELNLASTLRLSCATYLCSKRRIFEGRLNALRIDKEFRKTDAQQACKIDVNKASKLWTAYDKVGWFDQRYFTHLL